MSRSSHRSSNPAYYIEDCRILKVTTIWRTPRSLAIQCTVLQCGSQLDYRLMYCVQLSYLVYFREETTWLHFQLHKDLITKSDLLFSLYFQSIQHRLVAVDRQSDNIYVKKYKIQFPINHIGCPAICWHQFSIALHLQDVSITFTYLS